MDLILSYHGNESKISRRTTGNQMVIDAKKTIGYQDTYSISSL